MEQTGKVKNVFTNKNFVLAFLGAFVSNMGNILYSFAVSYYILYLSDNNALIQGLYLATGGITFILVVLFGGVISDRFHKGKIMYTCDYLKGIILIAFTILLMTIIKDNNSKITILFILAVIGNIIAAIFSPASSSLIPHIVPEESYQQAQSYYSLMNSVQSILGIVLAGVLYSVIPVNTLFIIVGGCYIVSGISEMFIRYNFVKPKDKLTIKTAFVDIKDAFKYVYNLKPIFYLIICILFVNFFFSPIFANFMPYFISTDVATSNYLFNDFLEPEMWNSIIVVFESIGSIGSAVVLSILKKKKHISRGLRISFILVSAVSSLFVMFYLFFQHDIIDISFLLISMVFIMFSIGVIIVTINVPIGATLYTWVEKEKLGKVSSLVDIGSQGLIPLSNLLGGIIISGLGTGALLIGCAAGFTIMTVLIIISKQIGKL